MSSCSTLLLPKVQAVLERLHQQADANDDTIAMQARREPDWESATAAGRATLLREALLPVSREAGRFLYGIARSMNARRVVEFGTSFGISTIYLAAAVRDNGGGEVIGSELDMSKVVKARQHLEEAGLADVVDIRAGDARQTLKDVGGSMDILFLDGWKEMYLELLLVAEGSLRPGAVVLADDVTLFPDQLAHYLDYVRNLGHGYLSACLPLGDGIEYSVKF